MNHDQVYVAVANGVLRDFAGESQRRPGWIVLALCGVAGAIVALSLCLSIFGCPVCVKQLFSEF